MAVAATATTVAIGTDIKGRSESESLSDAQVGGRLAMQPKQSASHLLEPLAMA